MFVSYISTVTLEVLGVICGGSEINLRSCRKFLHRRFRNQPPIVQKIPCIGGSEIKLRYVSDCWMRQAVETKEKRRNAGTCNEKASHLREENASEQESNNKTKDTASMKVEVLCDRLQHTDDTSRYKAAVGRDSATSKMVLPGWTVTFGQKIFCNGGSEINLRWTSEEGTSQGSSHIAGSSFHLGISNFHSQASEPTNNR
ncbi:hypothetical protein PROFUN_16254 [Planoprotostelium fungivorum]|uniref:Uncharacterized protein n=1 Tax=Planoprotostelium fungivorum TaxID=1890364 RepID=A0A2P6MRM8_9EUKA|nr:hypothetical protein PROFUN_16254 [Planoprotostelium fungivorum]